MGNLLNFGRQRGPRTNSTLCDFYSWTSNSTSCLTQTTTVILPLLSSGLAGSVCFVEALHTAAGPTPLTHAGSVLQKLWAPRPMVCLDTHRVLIETLLLFFPIMWLKDLLRSNFALCLPVSCPGSRDDVSTTLCWAPEKPKPFFVPFLYVCCLTRGTNGLCRELAAEPWEKVTHMREDRVIKAMVTHERPQRQRSLLCHALWELPLWGCDLYFGLHEDSQTSVKSWPCWQQQEVVHWLPWVSGMSGLSTDLPWAPSRQCPLHILMVFLQPSPSHHSLRLTGSCSQ